MEGKAAIEVLRSPLLPQPVDDQPVNFGVDPKVPNGSVSDRARTSGAVGIAAARRGVESPVELAIGDEHHDGKPGCPFPRERPRVSPKNHTSTMPEARPLAAGPLVPLLGPDGSVSDS